MLSFLYISLQLWVRHCSLPSHFVVYQSALLLLLCSLHTIFLLYRTYRLHSIALPNDTLSTTSFLCTVVHRHRRSPTSSIVLYERVSGSGSDPADPIRSDPTRPTLLPFICVAVTHQVRTCVRACAYVVPVSAWIHSRWHSLRLFHFPCISFV